MNKIEFAASIIPNFEARWEMYNATEEDLIGKEVVSITAGFSGMGGQLMLVDRVEHSSRIWLKQPNGYTKESIDYILGEDNTWVCDFKEKHNYIIFKK